VNRDDVLDDCAETTSVLYRQLRKRLG
jgi:hypothetical protein